MCGTTPTYKKKNKPKKHLFMKNSSRYDRQCKYDEGDILPLE